MDSYSKTLTLIVLTALAGLAASMPYEPQIPPLRFELGRIINQTVCPMEVSYNVDPSRVPQQIKELKCARDVNQWCAAMGVPPNECCQQHESNRQLACVEMEDMAMVYYPDRHETQELRVAVGCVCALQQSGDVPDATPFG